MFILKLYNLYYYILIYITLYIMYHYALPVLFG
jgi:hypothetical protein